MSKRASRWLSRVPVVALLVGIVFVHESSPSASIAPPIQPMVAPTVINVVPKITGTKRTFGVGSLIIPRDECYQYSGTSASQDTYCVSYDTNGSSIAGTASSDDGLIKSYGLMWFLLQNNIQVYSIINSTKTSATDVDTDGFDDTSGCATGDPESTDNTPAGRDFCINNPGTDAITIYDRANDVFEPATNPSTSPFDSIAYRGNPIIIDASQAATALALIKNGTNPVNFGHSVISTFDNVEIHQAEVGFTAEVFTILNSPPAPMAINPGVGGFANGDQLMKGYLDDAGLNFDSTGAAGGTATTSPAGSSSGGGGLVYEVVTATDVSNGDLQANGYNVVWFPHYGYSNGATDGAVFGEVADFLETKGTAMVAACAAVDGFETNAGASDSCGQDTNCTGHTGSTSGLQFSAGRYMTSNGVDVNGVSNWGDGSNEDINVGDLSHPFVQLGNTHYQNTGIAFTHSWTPTGGGSYLAGTSQLITTNDTSDGAGGPNDDIDLLTIRNKENDPDKGLVVYIGGHDAAGSAEAGALRLYLNTVFSIEQLSPPPEPIEVSRSQPIVENQIQYQGSFEYQPVTADQFDAGDTSFDFPAVAGHLRAFNAADLTAAGIDFDDAGVTPVFDATNGIPSSIPGGCGAQKFSGDCRTVFTNTTGGLAPTVEHLDLTPSATLQTMLDNGATLNASERNTLVNAILDAELGGIDRSGPHYVETSTTASTPGSQRPEMIYVGGADGMVHAICATVQTSCTDCSISDACDVVGKELWAFAPRTQVPYMRLNQAIVDGTAKHFEVALNGGVRTVLMFQTGYGETGNSATCAAGLECDPALYALDVTDPTAPSLLWELFLPGDGLEVAAGDVQASGGLQSLVFAQTNIEGGNGIYLAAVDITTGAIEWDETITNTADRGGSLPSGTGIPGGPTLVDTQGLGTFDRVLFGGLYGEIYMFDAASGSNEGHPGGGNDKPWVQWTTDYHPVGASVTIFGDGTDFYALAVTGGFADRSGAQWTDGSATQFAAAFNIGLQSPVSTNLTEADAVFTIDFDASDLNAGTAGAFASAVVAGDEVFIVLDSDDINTAGYGTGSDTGYMIRGDITDLIGGAANAYSDLITIAGGASSVDVDMANHEVFVGAGGKAQRLDIDAGSGLGNKGVFDDVGVNIHGTATSSFRRIWLRVQ